MQKDTIRLPAALNFYLFLLLITLLCLFASSGRAQVPEPDLAQVQQKPSATSEKEQNVDLTLYTDYLRGYASDLQYILFSPFRWERRDLLIASVVAGTVGGLIIFDRNISEWVRKRKSDTTQRFSDIGDKLGEGICLLPGLAVFYVYGSIAEDSRAKRTFLLGTESFLISGLFTTTLKYATHRQRPGDGDDPYHWHPPGLYKEDLSFCSGHAAAAFSIATVIAAEYKEYLFVPPIAYGLAGLTALSRVHDGAHWASDVFLGSAIGYLTAKTILTLNKKKDGVQIMPLMNGSGAGLSLSTQF